jgi:hypothetical protein
MKIPPLAIAGLIAVGLAGCNAPAQPRFDTGTAMAEFMGHVMDPAADEVWTRAGYVLTAEGEVELFPTTDEEWEAVETGAYTLVEASNALLLPGRLRDEPQWSASVAELAAAARQTQAAALAKDKDAVFAGGAAIFQACLSCHSTFVTPAPSGDQK